MAKPSFPRPGGWSVKLSCFKDEMHVPEGARMVIAPAGEGFSMDLFVAGKVANRFSGRAVPPDGLDLRPETGPTTDRAHLRPLVSGETELLVGVWVEPGGRGDTPVGVWVSEDDGGVDRPR